jgi:tRNA-(ms[2]io[6]A)-hydroxylase
MIEHSLIGWPVLELRTPTPAGWLSAVSRDLDAFLVDHAACERKASATGMNFVVRYPDRPKLIGEMIAFAREELEHFEQVWKIIEARGLRLQSDIKDPYVAPLVSFARNGREERLLDRLIVAGVVEARGCERFELLARNLDDPELREFYRGIVQSEARHSGLFLRLARHYFEPALVDERLGQCLDLEAEIVVSLPLRPALH